MAPVALTGTGNVTSATSGSAASLACNKPPNTTTGDALVCAGYFRNSGGTITVPSGWVQLGPLNTTFETFGLWAKPITNAGSEPASYTFSTSAGNGRLLLTIFRVTGAKLAALLDAQGTLAAYTGTSSITDPAVPGAAAGSLLLAYNINNVSSATVSDFTADAAMTEVAHASIVSGSSTSSHQIAQQQITSAGSTGTRTHTMSPSAANSGGFMVTIAAGTTTVATTPGSETDAAQPLGKGKTRTAALASSTETAQPAGRRKTRASATASSTEAAQPVGKAKRRALGTAAETNTAQAAGRRKSSATVAAAETDTAQAAGRRKPRAVTTAVATDAAQPLAHRKTKGTAPTATTDTAQPVTAAHAIPAATADEVEAAQPIGHRKTRALTVAETVDEAQSLSSGRGLQPALGNDEAQPLAGTKRRPVAQADETETAQGITRRKTKAVLAALETATAQTTTGGKRRAVTSAAETDDAPPITPPGTVEVPVPTASAVEAAQALTLTRKTGLTAAAETATAQALGRARIRPVSNPVENGAARAPGRGKTRTLGTAEETNLAPPVAGGELPETLPDLIGALRPSGRVNGALEAVQPYAGALAARDLDTGALKATGERSGTLTTAGTLTGTIA